MEWEQWEQMGYGATLALLFVPTVPIAKKGWEHHERLDSIDLFPLFPLFPFKKSSFPEISFKNGARNGIEWKGLTAFRVTPFELQSVIDNEEAALFQCLRSLCCVESLAHLSTK